MTAEQPPWDEMSVLEFLQRFGRRPEHLEVARLQSWWRNLVLRVRADGEDLVLRRCGVTPADEVRWELAVLAHLHAYEFPAIRPLGIPDHAGERLGELLGALSGTFRAAPFWWNP